MGFSATEEEEEELRFYFHSYIASTELGRSKIIHIFLTLNYLVEVSLILAVLRHKIDFGEDSFVANKTQVI